MLGFRIFFTALITLARKFPQAIYISFLPTLCVFMISLVTMTQADRMINFETALYVRIIGFLILPLPFVSWASVNWHRMIVLGEKPSPIPRIRDPLVLKHFWRLLVLMIGVIGLVYIAFYVIDYLITETSVRLGAELLLGLIILGYMFIWCVGMAYLMLRFSASFVGIATGHETTLRQSWGLTRPHTIALLVIPSAYIVLFVGLVILITAIVSDENWIVWVLLWLTIACIISVMTELYSYIRAQNDVVQVFE